MKYQELLEGLEVKEVLFSEILLDNEKFRIDDEFFMKEYISAYKKIKSIPHFILGNEISILSDFHANGSYEHIAEVFELLDEPNFAYMVRTTDLETNNFSENVKYITKQAYDFLHKSQIFGGELLINKIGTPGKSYLMPYLEKPVSLGMNLFLIRVKEDSDLNEKFLYVYFNTKFGQKIINRKVNGTVPLTIDKMAIKSLYIPKLEKSFICQISLQVDQAFELEKQAKIVYSSAEQLLLSCLQLDSFQDPVQAVNIKPFSASFGLSGRLDAEYYQVKYDALMIRLTQLDNALLKDLVKIKKSIEPGSVAYDESGLPFIRVSDYDKFQLSTPAKYLSDSFYNANKTTLDKLKLKKETILFSKDGSIGVAHLLTEDLNAVTSGAILHLKVKNKRILPEYLTLVLNSKAVQMQADRDAGGSIISHWQIEEIENVVIPIIPITEQIQIAQLVQQANQLRMTSKALLAQAKLAVENAIMA